MRRRLAFSLRRALVSYGAEAADWGVTVTDRCGNILAANEPVAELLGYDHRELEGLNPVDTCACVSQRKREAPSGDTHRLTTRQLEVLQLLADGKSTTQ